MMSGTSSKLTAAGGAGAVVIILTWVWSLFGLPPIPVEVGQAATLLIGLGVGWAVTETAIIANRQAMVRVTPELAKPAPAVIPTVEKPVDSPVKVVPFPEPEATGVTVVQPFEPPQTASTIPPLEN